MERARRSIRRSATRFISTDESESHLNVALQEWRTVKSSASSFAEIQREAAEFLMKWSLKEENRAIKDSAFQLNELVRLWADAQTRFADELQTAIGELNNIRDIHKIVREAEKKVTNFKDKEDKIKKEIQTACRWRKGGDVRLLQHTLQETTRDREIAEQQSNATKMEQEIFKMLRFKKSMNLLSQAYLNMAQSCTLVFEAHRDIINQIPDRCDVGPSQLPLVRYIGAPYTRERVEVVRRRLSEVTITHSDQQHGITAARNQRRRASDTVAHQHVYHATGSIFPNRMTPSELEPPPPYAP